MIEAVAKRAVDRALAGIEAAAAVDLPRDVKAEREGDRIVLTGPRVKLRALTDARIIGLLRGLFQGPGR